jgi:aspartate aminotransferase
MKLAARTGRIGESATMKVTRRAAELRSQGEDILSFGAGEPDFPSPPVAVEAAQRALTEGFTKYTPAAGVPDLRRALLERYERVHGAPWRRLQEVVVTVGAKAALFELALALLDRGDEAIVPSPCWVSFPDQVHLAGAEPVLVATDFADGFRVRAGDVLAAVGERTRAIILNSPCNPTGAVLAEDDLREIVDAASRRGIVVVCDETYEHFVYGPAAFYSAASLAAEYPETVALVGSFSKTYAMTGWRVGYVLGPAPLLRQVLAIQSHATSNPTSFAMSGALAALEGADADVERMIEEFRVRRDLVVSGLDALPGVSCAAPEGAFYVFPRTVDAYRAGEGSVELAERLLEQGGVAVVPGLAFGQDEHIRISFSSPRAELEQGIDRMAAVLRSG